MTRHTPWPEPCRRGRHVAAETQVDVCRTGTADNHPLFEAKM